MTALIRELERLAAIDPNGDGSASIVIAVNPVIDGRVQITAIVGLANGYAATVYRNTDDLADVLREVEAKARRNIGSD